MRLVISGTESATLRRQRWLIDKPLTLSVVVVSVRVPGLFLLLCNVTSHHPDGPSTTPPSIVMLHRLIRRDVACSAHVFRRCMFRPVLETFPDNRCPTSHPTDMRSTRHHSPPNAGHVPNHGGGWNCSLEKARRGGVLGG